MIKWQLIKMLFCCVFCRLHLLCGHKNYLSAAHPLEYTGCVSDNVKWFVQIVVRQTLHNHWNMKMKLERQLTCCIVDRHTIWAVNVLKMYKRTLSLEWVSNYVMWLGYNITSFIKWKYCKIEQAIKKLDIFSMMLK